MKISTAARNAACDSVVDLLDAGAGAATCAIRSGSPPTNVADADAGTLLATCTFSDPAFGSSASGTATANAITSDTNVDNTGTAGHFRCKDSDANTVLQGTVTATGGGGDMTFNTVSFVAGGTCAITAFSVTVPVGT